MPNGVPRMLLSGVSVWNSVLRAALCALAFMTPVPLVFGQTAPAPETPTAAQPGPAPESSSVISEYWRTLYGPGGVEPAQPPDPPGDGGLRRSRSGR